MSFSTSVSRLVGSIAAASFVFAGTTWIAWATHIQNPPEMKCQYVVRRTTIIDPNGPVCAYVSGSTVCGDCIRHTTGNPPVTTDNCPNETTIRRGNCDLLLASAGGSVDGDCVSCTEGDPPPEGRGAGGAAHQDVTRSAAEATGSLQFISTADGASPLEGPHEERLRAALVSYRYADAMRAALSVQPNGKSIVEPLERVVRERRSGEVSDEAWSQLARALVSGADLGAVQQEWQIRMPVGPRPKFDPKQWPAGHPGELFALPRELMGVATETRKSDRAKGAMLARAALLLESQTYVYLPPLFLNTLTATAERQAYLKDVADLSDAQVHAITRVAEVAVTDAGASGQGLRQLVQDLRSRNRNQGPLSDSQLQRLSRGSIATVSRPQKRPMPMYFVLDALADAVALVRERNGDQAATEFARQIREVVDFGDDPVVSAWAEQALGKFID